MERKLITHKRITAVDFARVEQQAITAMIANTLGLFDVMESCSKRLRKLTNIQIIHDSILTTIPTKYWWPGRRIIELLQKNKQHTIVY